MQSAVDSYDWIAVNREAELMRVQQDFASLRAWWNAHADKEPEPKRMNGSRAKVANGVYVDASIRHGCTTLGFVIVTDGRIEDSFSVGSKIAGSTRAEEEAVLMAKQMYPDRTIYCDCDAVCMKLKVSWVDRRLNPSHKLAYRRLNFRSRV